MSSLIDELGISLDDVPSCPRCSGASLLLARYPGAWANSSGQAVRGLRESVLCQRCDHADPAAADLLAFFLVDGHLDPANLPTFVALAAAWVGSVGSRTVDLEALAAEEDLWRRGELD